MYKYQLLKEVYVQRTQPLSVDITAGLITQQNDCSRLGVRGFRWEQSLVSFCGWNARTARIWRFVHHIWVTINWARDKTPRVTLGTAQAHGVSCHSTGPQILQLHAHVLWRIHFPITLQNTILRPVIFWVFLVLANKQLDPRVYVWIVNVHCGQLWRLFHFNTV